MQRMCSPVRIALFLAALVFLAGTASAQTATGTILGSVTDAADARVPGAAVQAVHVLTGETHKTASDNQGDYILPALPVGEYRIEVESPSFSRHVRQGIALSVNQNARVDVKLQMGAVSQQVTITGDAAQVDAHEVQMGALVDSKRLNELPLNGRNVYSLVTLLPGVSSSRVGSQPEPVSGSQVNINGSRILQTTYLLDGGFNNSVLRNAGLQAPNPDTVEEFRLITSNYNAEYGRSAGGVVSVVTKSGGNRLHGSLYDYLRNDDLDARSFFQPSVTKLRQNQFGGSLGGPIRRDKLFFFGSYQGARVRSSEFQNTARTPTAAQRRGDFSALATAARPIDTDTNAAFPGGIIPVSRLDPVALKILNYVPLPTTADGRVEATKGNSENNDQYFVKSDYLISAAHRLSGSVFLIRGDDLRPFTNSGGSSNIPDYAPFLETAHQNNVIINETWTVRPSLLNQFGFSHNSVLFTQININDFSWPDFGSHVALAALPKRPPRLQIGAGWNGGGLGDNIWNDRTYSATDTVTWVRGRHAIKAGASFNYLWQPQTTNWLGSGFVTVNGDFSRNSFADFEMGRASSFRQNNGFELDLRSKSYAAFFQDDWKISRRITLNLGLRYEVNTPFVRSNDRMQTFNPGQQSTVVSNAPLGMVFPGDAGVPRGLVETDRNNFAPRFGIAIDPAGNGKMAIRAGYGIFYSASFGNMANNTVGQPFFIDVSAFGSPNFDLPFSSFAGGSPFPLPDTFTTARFFRPITVSWVNRNLATPYVEQYNFSVERQLLQNLSLQVAYVGNVSRKLYLQRDANQPVFIPGAGRSTAANVDDRRPLMPGTYSQIAETQTGTNANYNSLQTTLNRRFSRSFTLLANYTYSKAIDEQSQDQQNSTGVFVVDSNNFRLDHAVSNNDLRHIFNLSFLWEAPKFETLGAVGRKVLGGWQLNGIARFLSGRPFTVLSGRDSNLNGMGNFDRPDLIGDPRLDNGRPRSERILRYFNPAAFQFAANGTNGTAGRNTLYGPGSQNWDVSLFKGIPIRERHIIQFRAEFFNVLNHANFGNPTNSISNANAGRILGAAAGRVVQLGLRYAF